MGNGSSFMAAGHQYTIVKELGSGSFGTTFLVIDEKGAKYALKFFQRDVSEKDFEKEVQNLVSVQRLLGNVCSPYLQCFSAMLVAQSSSPEFPLILAQNGLPPMTEYDYGPGFRGLLTRFVEGQTLTKFIPGNEVLAKEFLNQMLPVLRFLHHQQIVHRDIKPDNIMYNSKTNIFTLIDFGVSCVNVCEGITGTPFYMHPDLWDSVPSISVVEDRNRMRRQVDTLSLFKKSDIFSTGIVLYEILTGQRPFDFVGDRLSFQTYKGDVSNPSFNQILQLMLFKPEVGIDYIIQVWQQFLDQGMI